MAKHKTKEKEVAQFQASPIVLIIIVLTILLVFGLWLLVYGGDLTGSAVITPIVSPTITPTPSLGITPSPAAL